MSVIFTAFLLTTPTDLGGALEDSLTIESSRLSGRPRCWKYLHNTPDGCRLELVEYASYFIAAGEQFQLDPWILASMAWQESRLHAWATGRGAEIGIMQLHPSRRDVRDLAIVSDPLYRKRCAKKRGSCQREIVMLAASILRRSINKCGDLFRGLTMYNAGVCESQKNTYAKRVLRTKAELEALSGA